jgi:two-component system chemotaxis sensor kinase CheA
MPGLVAKLEALTCGVGPTVEMTPQKQLERGPEMKVYKVEFRPDPEMFLSGTNPLVLLRNLATLGTVSVCELHAGDLPDLKDLDPERCYLRWTIELATTRGEEEIREVFEFVEHLADIRIHCAEAEDGPGSGLIAIQAAEKQQGLGVVSNGAAPLAAAGDRTPPKKPASGGEASSIRVATDKVDRLIDLVGELVIAQIMTAQMVGSFTPDCLPKLRDAVAAMERNTRELHERVMACQRNPPRALRASCP